jgi:hypothetical protein
MDCSMAIMVTIMVAIMDCMCREVIMDCMYKEIMDCNFYLH